MISNASENMVDRGSRVAIVKLQSGVVPSAEDSSGERPEGAYEREAGTVMGELKATVGRLIGSLGVYRPSELQKMLKLDWTLSWQLCKIAGEDQPLALGPSIPSRTSMEKFLAGATKAGAPAAEISAVAGAYEGFESLVKRHADDRASFNSLATAVGGLTDEWYAADLQHRRNVRRAMSHALGVQGQTRLVSYVIPRGKPGELISCSLITGHIGLRILRKLDRILVHGSWSAMNPDEQPTQASYTPFERREDFLLREFCSQPLPKMELEVTEDATERVYKKRISVLRPEIGNLGTSTLVFGEVHHRVSVDYVQYTVRIPVESAVLDLIIERGAMNGSPQLKVWLGESLLTPSSIVLPVEGKHRLEFLGRGAGVLSLEEVPRYREMVELAAKNIGKDLSDFEVWRFRMEFPFFQCTSRISWDVGGKGS